MQKEKERIIFQRTIINNAVKTTCLLISPISSLKINYYRKDNAKKFKQ